MATRSPNNKKTPALTTLSPRDTRSAVAKSRAHSRVMGILRWALPLLALLMLGLLVAWPMMSASKFGTIVADNIPNLVIDNLHLTGLDSNNQPYTLTAAKALQVENVKNLIELEKPQGDIALKDGNWLAGKALLGRFDQANKNLWLSGDVQVFHDLGYQFSTSEARVDLDQNIAWGEKPVLIQGSFGEIQGAGFRVTERGNVVVIQGPAKAQLQLQATQPSVKTNATKKVSPK